MKTLNKHLFMGGVAACAVAFASCGEKTDSADAGSTEDRATANVSDAASTAVASSETEMVSISLSGLM